MRKVTYQKKKSNSGLKFRCFRCKKPMKTPGALLFSPPAKIHQDDICEVQKLHICCSCYYIILDNIVDNRINS